MAFNVVRLFSEFFLQHVISNRLFRKVARFLNKHLSLKKEVLVIVGKHKMYSNSLDRTIALYLWKFSALENFEAKIMEKFVKKGMCVLDIGANLGYYSLIFANLVGKNGKVYAFEPEPSNYRLLVKNIKANNYKNIISFQKAVSDSSGRIKLYISEEHKGDHRTYDPGDGRHAINIQAITIDNFCGNKIKPDLVKIDTQGTEFSIIKGMEKTIKRNSEIIITCEFWPSAIAKCGINPEESLKKLQHYGFKVFLINEKKKTIEPIDIKALMKMCKGNKFANLILMRM